MLRTSRVFTRLTAAILLLVGPIALIALLAAPAHAAQTRDMVFEAKILDELRATSPSAVSTFEDATAAFDAGDFDKASDLYSTVAKTVPSFVHAKRRACSALVEAGKRYAALPFCRQAVAQSASPENEAALASALVGAKGITPSKGEVEEALKLARDAAAKKPDQAYVWATLFQAAMRAEDGKQMLDAAEHLVKVSPDQPESYVALAFGRIATGDRDGAFAAIDDARAHGLPVEEAGRIARLFEEAGPPWWVRAALFLGKAVVVWFLALAFLLGAGYALSKLTLRAVTARPTEAHARSGEVFLRRVYRGLLVVASAYYYVSLPLLVVFVIAAAAGVIGGIVAIGYIAPKLFIIVAIICFVSVMSILRSIFVRTSDKDPGLPLALNANPALRSTLFEVARRIGTRPVDRVFLTPFTDVAVFDRGGFFARMRGEGERCLILGAGVLDGMRVRAFKSVLAHEYGHFRNEDTAGGGFALSVRRSLTIMTIRLATNGAASMINPAWWFVRGFGRAFFGVSQGASRLQEVLADRWAAFAYGSADFEEGLAHVIARGVRFEAHVDATLGEVMTTKAALPNLYAFVPAKASAETDIARAVDKVMTEAPSAYDSHPAPASRFEWVRALAATGPERTSDDDAEAWTLFASRADIEAQMTAEVRQRILDRRGVVVPAA